MTHKTTRAIWTLAVSLLAGVAVALGPVSPTEAASRPKSSAPKINPKILKPLQASLELANAGKYAEAEEELKSVQAFPDKTPFEQYQIDELLWFVTIKQQKFNAAAEAGERTLQSGQMTPEQTSDRLRILAQIFLQTEPRNMAKSGEYGKRWLAATGTRDPAMLGLVGQAAYFGENYGESSAYMKDAVATAVAAGAKPEENWLLILQSSYARLKNNPGITAATMDLARYYPRQEHWRTLVQGVLAEGAGKERRILQVFRFMYQLDAMTEAEDFTEAATVATQLGSPGEALKFMEKGYATGVLERSGDKTRSQALLADSRRLATLDQKALPQFEKEAKAAAAGEADVKLGEAFLSYDQTAKGLEAIRRGIAKGGVKNLDEANLSLARALIVGKNVPEALQAIEQVKSPEYARLAQLWTIYAGQL